MNDKGTRNYEKEYDYLRAEIMHHKNRQNTFSMFVCTALITVLGGAAVTHEQWITMLGFFIIFPCALKVFESRYSISLLATYMTTYLEPYAGIQWETNLIRYYDRFDRSWHEKIIYRFSKYDFVFYSIGTSMVYWVILYHNIKSYLVKAGQKYDYSTIFSIIIHQLHNRIAFVSQAFFILVIMAFTYRYYDYKCLKQNRIWKWEDLQKNQLKVERDEKDKVERAVQQYVETQGKKTREKRKKQ